MTTNPPLGYQIIPDSFDTLKDIVTEHRMVDKSVTIVKSAIQQYIDSFLNPNGVNRSYLTSSLSPVGLQFVTDLTYDEYMMVDPNLRKTYLARFFAENTGRLPSILIIDTGIEIVDMGINELISARITPDNYWECKLLSVVKVSLSITIATLSEEDTSTLATILATIMHPLPIVVNTNIITAPNSAWEVRLPMSGITLGQASNMTIEGDSKTTIWTRALDMTCDFETTFGFKQKGMSFIQPAKPRIGDNGLPIPKFHNLELNQEVKLGYPYPLFIEDMLTRYYLGVSNPNVAIVSDTPPYILQPKAQGRALLLVLDRLATGKGTEGKSGRYIHDVPFIVVR